MIERINIKNYAIIDQLELEPGQKFNVFSGETGAGKSIIVGALSLVLGARADTTVVRSGAEKAIVEVEFSISDSRTRARLRELEIEDNDSVIIRREISSNGKSRAFVNGFQEPITKLADIGEWLVDMHGQHDHQQLLNQAIHIDLLDDYAKLAAPREAVAGLYKELMKKITFKKELEQDEQKLLQEKVFWETAVSDIQKAGFQEGEEEELRDQLRRMENGEKISEALNGAYDNMYSAEGSIQSRMAEVLQDMGELAPLDARYKELQEILEDAAAKIDESVNILSDYKDELDYDPSAVDVVTDRMQLIKDLQRKYQRSSLEDLNAYALECADKLQRFENRGAELEQLTADIETIRKNLIEKSLQLSQSRQAAAKNMAQAIKQELAYLGMDKAEFMVDIKYVRDEDSVIVINNQSIKVTASGIDRVEFLISSNVGQEAKALRKVASGGEISRVMLALKSILAGNDSIETLVFDEIDTGIGGVTAGNVGEKMKSLASKKQLLVITHLAQIASKSEKHFQVSKDVRDGQTFTKVQPLSGEEKVSEIARMLGGESDTSRAHAREMMGL